MTEAIRATLQNVNRIVADNQESVKNSLRNLETFTAALARNSEKIDNVMLKVDGVMGKADSLMLGLNTIAGGSAGGELNLMVKSIRELAEDFDKRSGALIADGRRTLGDISRAVNNFDRNPSRVIFGGSNNARTAGAGRRRRAPAPHRRRRAGRSGSSESLIEACGLTVRRRAVLDQPVQILVALEERLDENPLVAAVDARFADVVGQPGMSVGRDAGIAKVAAVGRAGAHRRQHHRAGKEFGRQFCDRLR